MSGCKTQSVLGLFLAGWFNECNTRNGICFVLKLLGLGFRVKWQECCEFVQVLWQYRSHRRFLLCYCLLSLLYLFSSPYSVSRRYLKWMEADDIYTYGATPLLTLSDIMTRAGIGSNDHVFEMGAGSGYTSLWLNLVAGSRVTAIELVPGFVRRLRWLVHLLGLKGIDVRREDFLTTPLNGATVVYLFASSLDDLSIKQLAKRLSVLPSGTRIVSVSYPLQSYIDSSAFAPVDAFEASFPWGEADVFVQETV